MPKWIFQKTSGDQQGVRLFMKGKFDALGQKSSKSTARDFMVT